MYVIATAGHVDHGKSTLLRALTGMEPDRWAEEQRRGMTIDLGYVWTTLADGSEIAFVDVPGHQRFVANMLAGIGPVPAVLLVVAADAGWSRQTTEHVAALGALGVRHGILAISRSDLSDAELAASEAHDHLTGTSLEGIETVVVSGLTGAGVDDLRAALGRLVRSLSTDVGTTTRLWVDRVFSVRGSGTVVTGTLASGRIAVGDELVLMPGAAAVTVRGLQSLKQSVSSVEAVARVAVNLRGVKVEEVRRGSALVSAGRFDDVEVLDVRLTRADERLPKQAVLHIGSAAVPARVRRLGLDLTRLTLDTPLPLHVGERGLLRDPGAQRIVAGLVVLDPNPPSLHRRGAAAARAEALAGMTGRPVPTEEVGRRGVVRRDQLVRSGVLEPGDQVPGSAREVGGWLVANDQWARWQEGVAEYLSDWATQNPMSPGAPRAAVLRVLEIPDSRLLEALVGETSDIMSDAAGIHRTDAQRSFTPEVEKALSGLGARLALDPFDAPSVPELREAGLSDRQLAAAVKEGLFIRVAEGVYLRTDALDEAVARLAVLPQPFTVAEARTALGTTRRVMLPLLALLDEERRTQRIDDSLREVRRT